MKPAQSEKSTRIFNILQKTGKILLRILSKLSSEVLLLTFTIDSSFLLRRALPASVDSYFDGRFLLRRALPASTRTSGFDSGFVLPRLLWSSTTASGFDSVSGEFWTSRFKVFDCFGLRHRALTRASGFPVRFGGCHQHRLSGAGTAGGPRHWLRAGA